MLDEPVPGGARWWYVFGSVVTFILTLQLLTGILLASFYSPSSTTAWASVAFIQDQMTMGWFVRGLHSMGASAMVVMTCIHLAQVLIFGAYKAPREMNWIVGVLMMGLVLAFSLTGYLLPWDQKGYWATQVATSIIGTSPVVGSRAQAIAAGRVALRQLHADPLLHAAHLRAAGRDPRSARLPHLPVPPPRRHAALEPVA